MRRVPIRSLPLAASLAGLVLSLPAASQLLPAPVPTPAAAEPTGDPYRRETPYGSFFGYIRAAQKENWALAGEYMQWPKGGKTSREELAQKLKALLDERFVGDLEKLSRSPLGDLNDALAPDLDLVGRVDCGDDSFDLVLARTTPAEGPPIWLIAAQSLREVPAAFKGLTSPAIESHIPSFLKPRIGRFPLWQLLCFFLFIPLLYVSSRLLVLGVFALLRRVFASRARVAELLRGATGFRGPVALLLTVPLHRYCVSRLALPLLSRYYYAQFAWLVLIFALGWLFYRLIDFLKWRATLELLAAGVTATSSLTIARRLLRGAILAAGILAALAVLGVNLTATLAGLGIGGVALAFAAQKSLENLFGGLVVLSDKVIRVGDLVRIGTALGEVEDVTLHATRMRAFDRSVITIPNGSLITAQIENRSRRDKFWLNPTLGLVYETTAEQMRAVLEVARARLAADRRVEKETMRVRFVRLSSSSLDVEVFAYLLLPDYETFLAAQEELLIMLLEVVEKAGTRLALPSQMTYVAGESTHPLVARAMGRPPVP
ncbi:MAG TPA: mechanosensitive ion channel family protein [Thermoanaerobaculia bacterium]|nr:mechanosensitive ion channel family protein [Thermoanaerobaculia bacterium]